MIAQSSASIKVMTPVTESWGAPAGVLLACLMFALAPSAAAGMQAGERISERGPIDDDYYAAGAVVDIDAAVDGDLVIAGGELLIGHRVVGDVIAAGGSIWLRGVVDDDVRISGGELDIDARIGDDLVASGGSIELASTTAVAGDAWLVGGYLFIDGTIDGDLNDLRCYSEEQAKTNIEAYVEQLAAR